VRYAFALVSLHFTLPGWVTRSSTARPTTSREPFSRVCRTEVDQDGPSRPGANPIFRAVQPFCPRAATTYLSNSGINL